MPDAVTGFIGGKKAKKAAKKQKRIAQAISKEAQLQSESSRKQFEIEKALLQQQRHFDRLQTIREARIQRAQILQSAANAGVGFGSTAVQGGVGALQTTFASTLGIANIFNILQDRSAVEQTKIMESQGRVAQLQGQSGIVEANLAKSQANLQMWGSVAKGVQDVAAAAFGGSAGGTQGIFQRAFGGGVTTRSADKFF